MWIYKNLQAGGKKGSLCLKVMYEFLWKDEGAGAYSAA